MKDFKSARRLRFSVVQKGFLSVLFIVLAVSSGAAWAAPMAAGVAKEFRLHEYPVDTPKSTFYDENGTPLRLDAFKGKILVVTLWSTSCANCVMEMPFLDRLEEKLGGPQFKVVAISSGETSIPEIRTFYFKKKIDVLPIYSDPENRFFNASAASGLPVAFLIDEQGREIGRIQGLTDWQGKKMQDQIYSFMKKIMKSRWTQPSSFLDE